MDSWDRGEQRRKKIPRFDSLYHVPTQLNSAESNGNLDEFGGESREKEKSGGNARGKEKRLEFEREERNSSFVPLLPWTRRTSSEGQGKEMRGRGMLELLRTRRASCPVVS